MLASDVYGTIVIAYITCISSHSWYSNSKEIVLKLFPLSNCFKTSTHSFNVKTYLSTFDIATLFKTDSDETNIFHVAFH